MGRLVTIAFATMIAPPAWACEIPLEWQKMEPATDNKIEVAAKLPGQPIKIGEQFQIDILVCGKVFDTSEIEIDATMPAHKHGMNYLPDIAKLDTHRYRASGLFFHMPGQWRFTLDLKGQTAQRFHLNVAAK